MRRVKRRGMWAQCGHGGLARPKNWRDAARKPTNDKKQALPASQKPRVMRIIITMRYARRGPQFGGSGDDQTQGEGGWGAGCARATTEASFRSITWSRANAKQRDHNFWSGIISKIAITQDRTHRFPSFKAWASAQDAA